MSDSKTKEHGFEQLVSSILDIHDTLGAHASKAVNISLTVRNWLIGCYIAEYELHGADRASYGENLLRDLAVRLTMVSNCNRRQLYDYLKFYRTYPQIVGTVSAQFQELLPERITENDKKVPILSAQLALAPEKLISNLSYSKFKLLAAVDDETKRAFYELECVRGNWSVRELKRQIASLYYERSGLSKDKKKLAELTRAGTEKSEPKLAIRDPYIFEFLGIKPTEVMAESALEDALTGKLRGFLLELGHGFCFEAHQKRILIGDTYGFVDLVFYHRVLKCHILIDLKIEDFSHENIGQHPKNIFAESELDQNSVVKNFFTTAADGKQYKTNFYNLDAVISVGYRVKSVIATRFRIWATERLKEHIVKGYTMARGLPTPCAGIGIVSSIRV